ncbi:LysR substrate-binding domain-containing protein [Curvibacter sp. HBC28]|uniref:LysR substrate-binding domain-containing protein n=1 Tax=Curvibacter microcysteis TaxID=3026419 RepID=A0ABT5MH87_9BURK|nr:LysR substrate-binding domain-containing protein [Curvibacter sp. HBC28]MDD0814545.1 LysR substrate-binding domain-containing protein [Curvibacter sp. HBC28]
MRRLTPPTHLLRAFSSTARYGSISRAAEALMLTQSAVSKQIQELERWVDVPLFQRERRRLSLTPAGQRYEAQVRPLLAQLEAATLELITHRDGGGALKLSTLPTFGAKWLIPRLPRFQQAHPQITLNFVPYVEGYDFHRADLDASILFGDGHWPGAVAQYLTGRELVLIAPPAPRDQALLRTPQDIRSFTLLQHSSVPQAWLHWCQAHGVTGVNPLHGPQLDQFHSLIRAVMAGMGLALVPDCLVADDLAAGLVSAPLRDGYTDTQGYWLVYPEDRAQLGALTQLRQWLHDELSAAPGLQPA